MCHSLFLAFIHYPQLLEQSFACREALNKCLLSGLRYHLFKRSEIYQHFQRPSHSPSQSLYEWTLMVCTSLCLASFTQQPICEVHLSCSKKRQFVYSHLCMRFCCINKRSFIYCTVDRTLIFLQFIAIMNSVMIILIFILESLFTFFSQQYDTQSFAVRVGNIFTLCHVAF